MKKCLIILIQHAFVLRGLTEGIKIAVIEENLAEEHEINARNTPSNYTGLSDIQCHNCQQCHFKLR